MKPQTADSGRPVGPAGAPQSPLLGFQMCTAASGFLYRCRGSRLWPSHLLGKCLPAETPPQALEML